MAFVYTAPNGDKRRRDGTWWRNQEAPPPAVNIPDEIQNAIGNLTTPEQQAISDSAIQDRLWGSQNSTGGFEQSGDIGNVLNNSNYLPNPISNQPLQQSPDQQLRSAFMQNPQGGMNQTVGTTNPVAQQQAPAPSAWSQKPTGLADTGVLAARGSAGRTAQYNPPAGPNMARDNAVAGQLGGQGQPQMGGKMPRQGQPQGIAVGEPNPSTPSTGGGKTPRSTGGQV